MRSTSVMIFYNYLYKSYDNDVIRVICTVRAKVHLDVSNLTQFQSSVYKNMLENSIKNGRGGITFTSSK